MPKKIALASVKSNAFPRESRRLFLLIKIVVSGALIGLLLSRFDLATFSTLLDQLDKVPAIVAVILLIVQFPLSAWKWQKSLQAHEFNFGFGYLLRVLCIAFFFNNFLPTSIGGDAYRAYRTSAPGHSRVRPISAVVLERLLGILALIVIGVLCMLLLLLEGGLEHAPLMRLLLISAFVFTFVILAAWYTDPIQRLRQRIADSPKLHHLVLNMRSLAAAPTRAWTNRGALIRISISFCNDYRGLVYGLECRRPVHTERICRLGVRYRRDTAAFH